MSFLDKVGDFLGDVVEGVVDFVDDVFNIDLAKILSNDIVKYGLMAVGLFTGGVAIVNGVMTGFSAASGATGFMNTFVAGAKGFVEGALTGFANPLQAAKSIGTGNGPLLATGAPGASQLGEAMAGEGSDSAAQQLLSDMGDDAISSGIQGGAGNMSDAAIDQALGATTPDFGSTAAQSVTDMGDDAISASMGGAGGASGTPSLSNMAKTVTETATKTAAEPSVWSKIADGAIDFATSPAGMQTLTGMASGWAEGQMMQEKWDNERKDRMQVRDSWSSGNAPRSFGGSIPSLQQMREQIRDRGNAANAKYGY